MIVKVQISLSTSETERQILVYNKSRTIMQQFAESEAEDVVKAMGKDLKGFFDAKLNKDGYLVLNGRLPRWSEDRIPW